MSKTMLAFGSFIVGACCAFAISSLIHTLTVVQSSSAQVPSAFADEPSPSETSEIPGTRFVSNPDSVPTVPDLSIHLQGMAFAGGVQQLDGVECKDCTIGGVTLTYGGGSYLLSNAKVIGPIRVVPTGAAANTLRLFFNLGIIKLNVPDPPPTPSWLQDPNPKIDISTPAETTGKTLQLISLSGPPKR